MGMKWRKASEFSWDCSLSTYNGSRILCVREYVCAYFCDDSIIVMLLCVYHTVNGVKHCWRLH